MKILGIMAISCSVIFGCVDSSDQISEKQQNQDQTSEKRQDETITENSQPPDEIEYCLPDENEAGDNEPEEQQDADVEAKSRLPDDEVGQPSLVTARDLTATDSEFRQL